MIVKVKETPRLWRFALFLAIALLLLVYVFRSRPEVTDGAAMPPDTVLVPGGSLPAAVIAGTEIPATRMSDSLADARVSRDRARSQEMEGLAALAANQKLAEETRAEAGQRLVGLTERTAREVEVEGLLRARGYADAVVFVHMDTAEVIVKSDIELTAVQAYAIADVVARATGLSVQQVTVLPRP